MTVARAGCPEWCEQVGEHETHRRWLSGMIATDGSGHECMRLGLMRPSRRHLTRIEMVIYRRANEVMRVEAGEFSASDIAAELIAASIAVSRVKILGRAVESVLKENLNHG